MTYDLLKNAVYIRANCVWYSIPKHEMFDEWTRNNFLLFLSCYFTFSNNYLIELPNIFTQNWLQNDCVQDELYDELLNYT